MRDVLTSHCGHRGASHFSSKLLLDRGMRLASLLSVKTTLLLASTFLIFGNIQPAAFGQTARIAAETSQSIKKREAQITALLSKIKKKMDRAEWAEFEKTQRAWVAFRDQQVKFYENHLGRFNASQNIALFVADELVEARVKQLTDFLDSWNSD